MPQFYPMNWMFIFFYIMIIYFMLMVIMYFTYYPSYKNLLTNKIILQKNWKW
nr:ATP synthase F0 subunit 8 [Chiropterargas confusus]